MYCAAGQSALKVQWEDQVVYSLFIPPAKIEGSISHSHDKLVSLQHCVAEQLSNNS